MACFGITAVHNQHRTAGRSVAGIYEPALSSDKAGSVGTQESLACGELVILLRIVFDDEDYPHVVGIKSHGLGI